MYVYAPMKGVKVLYRCLLLIGQYLLKPLSFSVYELPRRLMYQSKVLILHTSSMHRKYHHGKSNYDERLI